MPTLRLNTKKTKRSRPYFVEFGGNRHKVTSAEFHDALLAGHIERTDSHNAKAKATARLENGRLLFSGPSPYVRTSWTAIDRKAPNVSEDTRAEFLKTYAPGYYFSWSLVSRLVKMIGWNGTVPVIPEQETIACAS